MTLAVIACDSAHGRAAQSQRGRGALAVAPGRAGEAARAISASASPAACAWTPSCTCSTQRPRDSGRGRVERRRNVGHGAGLSRKEPLPELGDLPRRPVPGGETQGPTLDGDVQLLEVERLAVDALVHVAEQRQAVTPFAGKQADQGETLHVQVLRLVHDDGVVGVIGCLLRQQLRRSLDAARERVLPASSSAIWSSGQSSRATSSMFFAVMRSIQHS